MVTDVEEVGGLIWVHRHVRELCFHLQACLHGSGFAFFEVPEVEIVLIDRPDQPIKGAGNLRRDNHRSSSERHLDATDVCLRLLPFMPERVLKASEDKSTILVTRAGRCE